MDRANCGHRLPTATVTYCEGCFSQLVARAEKAEALVKQRDQDISNLVLEHRALLARFDAATKAVDKSGVV